MRAQGRLGRRVAWTGVATVCFAVGCGGAHAPGAPAAAGRRAESAKAAGPIYRFVPVGGNPEHFIAQRDGRVMVVGGVDDRREVLLRDGSMTSAPAVGMGGAEVPARFGGGYLFWDSFELRYAKTFLGDPIPLATIATNVLDVQYGHDALFLFGPNQRRREIALDPPRRVPLSPHGVVAIGGADDDRVLAVDAAGRSRASIDGGKTWQDVTAEIGESPEGVLGLPGDVAFVLAHGQGAWLHPDGTFERRPLPPPQAVQPREWKSAEMLLAAVLGGWPAADGRALVTNDADIFELDMSTGEVSGRRRIGREGASCRLWTTSGGGLATCDRYSVHGADVADVVAAALGDAPVVDKTFAHHPARFVADESLVVVAPCASGAPAREGVVCVRNPSGVWTQLDAGPALGSKWRVLGWLGRQGGAPVAIVWQGVRGRKPDYGLLDPIRGQVVTFDADVPGLGGATGAWTVRSDGSIHGFTGTGTVTVDPGGHVTFGARSFGVVASEGDHALARDVEGRLWQSTDAGASWLEVARPPVDGGSGPSSRRRRLSFSRMQCGRLGCAIEHPSGFGSWLRIGWPEDPPHAESSRESAVAAAATLDAAAAAPARDAGAMHATTGGLGSSADARAAVPLARLVCTFARELRPSAEPSPGAAAGAKGLDALGGTSFPARPGADEMTVVPFRDQFRGPDDGYAGSAPLHALRTVLRAQLEEPEAGEPVRVGELAAGSVDAIYVEAFDPTGRLRRASGSLAPNPFTRARRPKPARPAPPLATTSRPGTRPAAPGLRPPRFDLNFEAARPVLSAATGGAAGVLVGTHGSSLWIAPSGAVRRVAPCEQTYGGVVDAAGKLWVACGDYSRAVRVIDGETGRVRLELPPVLPWVWQPEARFPFYGGGRAVDLPNPDAIAVDAAGNVAVLRVPSAEPATVDDPAWLLAPGASPVELAPWSTLEPASSPACTARDGGGDEAVRALIQTAVPWVTVDGAPGFREPPGMTALVRWGRRRVCLEAIEVGYRRIDEADEPRYGVQVMLVDRFVGVGAGAGLVGLTRSHAYRAPASCRLVPPVVAPSP